MSGQRSLNLFYKSVKITDPILAAVISEDVLTIALDGDGTHHSSEAREAVTRVRERSEKLTPGTKQLLERGLTGMGYS